MKHNHPMPFPTKPDELMEWLQKDAKAHKRLTDKKTKHLIGQLIKTVTPENLWTLLAGYTVHCPACHSDPQSYYNQYQRARSAA